MSSTGYQSPGSATGTETSPFYMYPSATDDVGGLKLGGDINLPNVVTGPALRQKQVSFTLSVDTQVSVAHGCTDSAGNAVVPVFAVPLYSNGDGYYVSQAPDATNIYLTAPAGATTSVTGVMVVVY